MNRQQLTERLDALQAQLPKLREQYPDPADFWPAFAGIADELDDAPKADADAQWFRERMDDILTECDIMGMMTPD